MRLNSFFFGALCVMSGGRLPAALFMVFLLDSKGKKVFNLGSFLQKTQKCKSCRLRQELANEYLLANLGVDIAGNGSLKVCQKISNS